MSMMTAEDPCFEVSTPVQDAARLVRESLCIPEGYHEEEGQLNTHWLLSEGVTPGSDTEAVLVIGAFDGFHLGHRALAGAAVSDARERKVPCIAVMFDPDPDEHFHGDDAPLQILACADRARALAAFGVDAVCLLRFDADMASMEPTAFVKLVLCKVAKPVAVHVGSNFRFGCRGMGTPATLGADGASAGFGVVTHELVEVDGAPVSSTRIRKLLAQGKLGEAHRLLGRCHFVRGIVEHGRGEGTSFGFPTANVRTSRRSCMPAQGVYGGYVTLDGVAWPAAINVGAPPTFAGPDEFFLEANLIGFSGDLYGDDVCVTFVSWLRASRPFDSTEELERVVLGNIEWVRNNLGDGGVEVARDH